MFYSMELADAYSSLVTPGFVDDPTKSLIGRPAKFMAVTGKRGEGWGEMSLHYELGMAVGWLYECARKGGHVPGLGDLMFEQRQLTKVRHLREYMDQNPMNQFVIYKLA